MKNINCTQCLQQLQDDLTTFARDHVYAVVCLRRFKERFWKFGNLLNHRSRITEFRSYPGECTSTVFFEDFSGCELLISEENLERRIAQFRKEFPRFYRGWLKDKRRTAKIQLKELERFMQICDSELPTLESACL